MLKPCLKDHVERKQSQQKSCHDSNISRVFSDKEGVYANGFGTGPQWISGTIEEVMGPVSCLVRLEDVQMISVIKNI